MADTIDIQLMGETITVPRWASEETLVKLANSIESGSTGLGKTIKEAKTALGQPRGPGFTGTIKKTTVETDKLRATTSTTEKALQGMSGVISGAGGIIGGLAQSTGKFSDLNTVTAIMIDSFTSLTSAIPLAGTALTAFGDVAKVLFEFNNQVMDDTIESFYTLSGAGFGLQNDLLELAASARAGNLSLSSLTENIMNAQQGVLVLGGSFDAGVKRFTSIQAMLRDEEGDFARALKGFGYGAEETADFLAQFLQDQRSSLAIRNMSEDELAQRSFQYAKNLRIISEFTGQEVDDMRAARAQIAADGAFQSKLQQMRLDGMSKEAAAIEELVASLPTDAAKQAAIELFTFGGSVTEQSALFNQIAPEFQASVEQLFADTLAKGQFVIDDNEAYASTVKAIADISTNAGNLEVGTFAMLGQSNALSDIIANTVVQASNINAILDRGGSVRDAVDSLGTITKDTNDQIAGVNISDFNDKLITLATALESVGPDIQKAILENMEPLTVLQLSAAQGLVDVINDTKSLLEESFKKSFENLAPGSASTMDFSGGLIYDDVLNFLLSPLFGVGGTNYAGMDVGLLDYVPGITTEDVGGATGFGERLLKDLYSLAFGGNGKASGGRVGGGLYMVGERGPELLRMDPGSSGHVYSNAVTTAMATPRYAGGPVMGDLDIGSTASTATAETQESSALPSMQRGAYTGTTSFANELKNGLMPIANVEAEMKAMRRDIKNLMTKVLTANGHF